MIKRSIGGIVATGALFAGALGAFAPSASAGGALYAIEAGDHGPGGWAGGSLFAGGGASGSGNIAGPGGAPVHITLTSWNTDAENSGSLDVNFFAGGAPGCVVLPVTHGPQQQSPLFFGGCDSTGGHEVGTVIGKATPTG